ARAREGERAADPERVRHPVEDRGDATVEAPERQLRPLVRAALHRVGGADLRHQEHVGGDEEDRREHEPEEALRAVLRDGPERVEADERADREEHHVEPAQRLDQLALLLEGERRRLLERYWIRCHASSNTSPRVPVMTSNSCCVAMSGGEIWMTGSPRSSALQMRPFSNSRGERNSRRSDSVTSYGKPSLVSLSRTSSSA